MDIYNDYTPRNRLRDGWQEDLSRLLRSNPDITALDPVLRKERNAAVIRKKLKALDEELEAIRNL